MANVPFPPLQHNAAMYNVVPQENQPGRRHARTFKALGITQLSLGCLSVLLSILGMLLDAVLDDYLADGSDVGAGIWCGFFFVVAGILGIVASKQPGFCQVNALMALSIVSAITSGIMASIEGSVAGSSRSLMLYGEQSRLYSLYVILSLVAAVEFFVSITCSAFCCSSTCCGYNPPPYPATVVTTATCTTAPMVAPTPFVTVQGPPQHEIQPILQQSQVIPSPAHHQPYHSYPVTPQHPPYPLSTQQNPTQVVLPQQVPPQLAPPQFQAFQSPPTNLHYAPGVSLEASTQPPPYTPQAEQQTFMKGY